MNEEIVTLRNELADIYEEVEQSHGKKLHKLMEKAYEIQDKIAELEGQL
jgi:hypothetical protein